MSFKAFLKDFKVPPAQTPLWFYDKNISFPLDPSCSTKPSFEGISLFSGENFPIFIKSY